MQLYEKETSAQVFSYEFGQKNFNNTFLTELLRAASSESISANSTETSFLLRILQQNFKK